MTAQFKIEKNVPVRSTVRETYPFADMQVGDSFALPDELSLTKARSAATNWGKKNGRKFSCRLDGKGGGRIWRIA